MAIAFAGLLLSDTAMLNQSSVMLVSAVLVDTFVGPAAFAHLVWLALYREMRIRNP